jgi:hypothetical protein
VATPLSVGDLKARAAFARVANVGEALRAVSSEAAVLEWLARQVAQAARSGKSRTAKRCRLMAWLGRIKTGETSGAFGRYTEAEGRAALAATARGGLAAAAAELTGKRVELYLEAQRNGSRGKPRSMCRTRKRP